MKAVEASRVILVQSIELIDEEGVLLHLDERREANALLEGEDAGSPLEAISARAELLFQSAQKRAPWLTSVSVQFSSFPWVFVAVLIFLSMLFGAGFQVLDGGRVFHVLSFPLLGILVWNIMSLCLLLLSPFLLRKLRSTSESSGFMSWGTVGLSALLWIRKKWFRWRKPSLENRHQEVAMRSLQRFLTEWPIHAKSLLQAQAQGVLHLCTVGFSVSALLIAYGSGLTKAYLATAESTFLSTIQIKGLLNLLFAPSQWILGSLPSLEASKAGLIGPAAPWIHHYAVTMALFVILPRLLLVVWSFLRSMRLSSRLPFSMDLVSEVPTLNVALSSHTNVGKTSLARTLLRRDVGEVRDAEHVTKKRAGYFLLNFPDARLRLWDTPGFGDAKVLVENLRAGRGWSWIRSLGESELHFDREAALSLKEEADLILYLVPAHATPENEEALRNEWSVLSEVGQPVLCLLNRLEEAEPIEEKKLIVYWKSFFSSYPLCKGVLSLDAFSRSWKDERSLFKAIELAVTSKKKPLAQKLREYREHQHEKQQKAIGFALALLLQKLSEDKERDGSEEGTKRFQDRAQMLILEAQNKMLEQFGLKGEIKDKMISQSEQFLKSMLPNKGEKMVGSIVGGFLGGLATGLATDILAGGLTFGGGAVVGAVLGAIGGAGLAEGYRRVGSIGSRSLIWEEDFLKGVGLRLVLLYLTATSFGRAQGDFNDEVLLGKTDEGSLTEKQKSFFMSAEDSLKENWPYLWPLLASFHESKSSKIWTDLVNQNESLPAWVKHAVSGTEAEESFPEDALTRQQKLEEGCDALLHDALEKWEASR